MSDGWVCESELLPAIKWFSATDQTRTFPEPIKCVRVDKAVHGFSYKEWAAWYKLLKFVDGVPIPP